MKKIRGKDLLKLGFHKEIEVDPEDEGFHYYTYEINNHCLLISDANNEGENGYFSVEIFEYEGIVFRDLKKLKKLIKLLKEVTNER